ncbi:mechanosensitive ion channel family protein [Coccidioides immitis RS]|uniref:Mechanosensitive ion channel family protein n=1 Tax=Coccidioides immitis (strain RS) TaxID=246410 RepID=J3KJ63_COCIM|nr:mechanosensitive ion channel family protein [Coccidioides immitis RS]EAS36066.3 mechanosensitive ion channel family protein [Coccidioides immitis RS]
MSTPVYEGPEPSYGADHRRLEHGRSSTDETIVGEKKASGDNGRLGVDPSLNPHDPGLRSPSQTREEAHRLDDDLAVLQAERQVSRTEGEAERAGRASSVRRSRSRRTEPVDEFDAATNPLHEQSAVFKPPENPTTSFARFVKKVHNSSFLVRYFTYITPLVLILLIPLLVGALAFPDADVGGVSLMWFAVWLEIFWLTLWAGRIVAKCIPVPVGIVAGVFTNNAKKWRDLAKQLEFPATLFFWWLAVEISFLPTMKNHHIDGNKATKHWELVVNKIIISIFVGTTLNFIEKIIIQLIAISFHLRTYADRIELNKFQIGSLTKLYDFSKKKITMEDRDFEERPKDGRSSGTRTPMMYADRATRVAREALHKVGDVAGAVAGDFTGRKVNKSNHPYQVVLALLNTTSGSQVLARRLYRTFVREGFQTVFSGDLKAAFENDDEADAAFNMFDKDMNGDISMEELEAVCVEIGRERKSITASLKDLDSVVSKLDDVFVFIVVIITILVFLSLISTSAAGVLASAGSTLLALSWLFSATAQEFLQSIIFVFVKHPFDVGDRVSIYGNTGANLTGDDYFVKEIALLYTEFKKMEGHVVQAPNSYLNTLFILNQRRSGGLAEAVPIIIKFGTTLQQIDALRQRLLEFVLSEKREYQSKVLTELRQVTENYSITLNVVFFYKSNWQNELLRLQRRNKFICNLMISLQEVGIEGPRMNLVGYTTDLPYHVAQGGSAQPTPTGDESSNSPPPPPAADPQQLAEARDALGELGGGYSTGVHPRPSILRRPGASTRGRGDSINKHVDFSLGMSELSSADMMSDVYADRERNRVDDIIRSANRESAERRIQEQQERESLERSRSQQYRPSIDSHRSGMGSTTSSVHRNRFFGRLGGRAGPHQHSTRGFQGDDDMMEQGQYAGLPTNPEESLAKMDPRTGNVSSRAVHDDELGRQRTGSDAELMQARSSDRVSEEYEMGRLGGRP